MSESTKSTLEFIAKNPSLQVIELATTDGQKREFVFDNASEVLVDDDDLASVRVIANEQDPPGYSVEITLKPDMANWLAERTKQLSQRPKHRPMLGIFVDGKLHSAPRLNSPISDGRVLITGRYTKEEAEKIASDLQPDIAAVEIPQDAGDAEQVRSGRDDTHVSPDNSKPRFALKLSESALPELLTTLQARDREFDNRTLEVEFNWDELMTPRGLAQSSRHNAIRFGGLDPGMPEGLPDDYQQPHRARYWWTRRGHEVIVEQFADLEKAVHEQHSRMAQHRLEYADAWKYLLPCGIGFADDIRSIASAVATEGGYVIKGLLRQETAVIDGRQNSFVIHLDKDLIIRRAELQYHVYDIVVVTSGVHRSPNVPATAKRGDFTKYYIATKGERMGERSGIAEHFAYQVLSVSDRLTDGQFDERVRNNPLKEILLNGLPELPDEALPSN